MPTFTVKELIEELKKFDEDLPVYAADYSDIDNVSIQEVDEEGEENPDKLKRVVILHEIPF